VAAAFAAALGTRARGAAGGGCVPGCRKSRKRKSKKDRHHPPVATEKWRE
jgi:hypothetical protein